MTADYTIGDYLLDRLAELGITELFGVPGDYNLHFLDHVVSHPGIRWVGSANELNAGYTADGYARLRGAGALLTTYGVGELSAANAIAGSYAESVPVIHIVGAPAKHVQARRQKLHHSLGGGDFQSFIRMAEEITCAAADLEAPSATWEIDRVLRTVMFERKPGFLLLAADVAATPTHPARGPLEWITQHSTLAAEQAFEEAARAFLPGRRAAILADLAVHRFGAGDALNTLLDKTRLPVATLSWGKSLVDESAPHFVGIYAGAASDESVIETVEGADALITLGVDFTDNTTAGFSTQIDPSRQIEVRRAQARVNDQVFTPLGMERAIEILTEVLVDLDQEGMPVKAAPVPVPARPDDQPLTQDVLWRLVSEALTPASTVLAEQGTSYFGMATHRFPRGAVFIGQPMWGSIGYTLPAALGVGLADPTRRPVLLIGDGSAQLTIQELGQIVREKVPAVILLVNNSGYTVERAIHGARQPYNDIPAWRWSRALEFFGADPEASLSMTATTGVELADALRTAAGEKEKLVFIEAVTGPDDVPDLLRMVAEAL